jgi:hypothetical protein
MALGERSVSLHVMLNDAGHFQCSAGHQAGDFP